MEMNLGDKLKSLRKEKNISQEKLAQYLNVSFQAVSKWENSNTYPDISLLPDIARFFGITIDELLQAEKIDEKKLFSEYEEKAIDLVRTWRNEEVVALWQEAYHKMPNNVDVKEMLMSSYFDADKVKYQKEIIELGTEIYNSNAGSYFKGQAIEQVARTYAENGNGDMAEQWARKAYQIMHSQEYIFLQILEDGKELVENFSFANYWFFNKLFYMAARLIACKDIPGGTAYTHEVEKAVAKIYEIVYPGDDMGFEDLRTLCTIYRSIAEDEASLGNDEAVVRHGLARALECAEKSMSVKEHDLKHPLVMNWHVLAAPSDHKQIVQLMKNTLGWECFDGYRKAEWFTELEQKVEELLR